MIPVTIGVYLSNVCHYRRIFVQCLSQSAYICPMPVQNHQTRYNSLCFSTVWNSSPDLPDLPDVSRLLRFGTSSTQAGGQDDVSSNQLPQTIVLLSKGGILAPINYGENVAVIFWRPPSLKAGVISAKPLFWANCMSFSPTMAK